MNILDFADEEPWARQAFKYTTNFPISDIFISWCQKTKPTTTILGMILWMLAVVVGGEEVWIMISRVSREGESMTFSYFHSDLNPCFAVLCAPLIITFIFFFGLLWWLLIGSQKSHIQKFCGCCLFDILEALTLFSDLGLFVLLWSDPYSLDPHIPKRGDRLTHYTILVELCKIISANHTTRVCT